MTNHLCALVMLAGALLWSRQITTADRGPRTPFPVPPPPSECVVSPVSEELLRPPAAAVRATPLAPPSEGTSALSLFPNSESAGSADRQAIEALERQFAACWNANDWRRLLALTTRSFIERGVAAAADRIDDYFPATAEPFDRLDWETVMVEDVRRVDGGRLAALVDFCAFRHIHYYKREEGKWRIDDIIDIPIEGGAICEVLPPATATPT